MKSLVRGLKTAVGQTMPLLSAVLDARGFKRRTLSAEEDMKRLNSSFKTLAADIGKDGSKL